MSTFWDDPAGWFSPSGNKTKKSSGSAGGATVAIGRKSSPKAKANAFKQGTKFNAVKSAPQVMVKITGSSKSGSRMQAHANYIGQKGQTEIENQDGEKFLGDEHKKLIQPWLSQGIFEWDETEGAKREALHIVFSMPEGTDPIDVKNAARATVEEEFKGHKYLMALHENTDKPHVHVLLNITDDRGSRLNPRKADLQNYRQSFAKELNDRGVEATASRTLARFKHKQNEPQWKYHNKPLKDKVESRRKPLDPAEKQQHLEKIAQTHSRVFSVYENLQKKTGDKDLKKMLDEQRVKPIVTPQEQSSLKIETPDTLKQLKDSKQKLKAISKKQNIER